MMVKNIWEQIVPSQTHVLFKHTLRRQPRKKNKKHLIEQT